MDEAPELVEDTDFYWDGTYMVFTAQYLIARGSCCKSGCRHCPYGFKKDAGESSTEK